MAGDIIAQLIARINDQERQVGDLQRLDVRSAPTFGIFTPTIADATSGGNTGTAATAAGIYYKDGRKVQVSITLLDIDTTGMTGGNALIIRDLPYAATAETNYFVTFHVRFRSIAVATYPLGAMSAGVALVSFREGVSGGNDAAITVSDLTSGAADIFFSLDYVTD